MPAHFATRAGSSPERILALGEALIDCMAALVAVQAAITLLADNGNIHPDAADQITRCCDDSNAAAMATLVEVLGAEVLG